VKDSVLLAWGLVADKRWRDIIALAVSEDTLLPTTNVESKIVDKNINQPRRRPLLLYFPHHNQLQFLGAHRSLVLSERLYIGFF
jgi:hypothetical protein